MQITWAFYQMAEKDSSDVKMMPAFEYVTSGCCVNFCAGDVRVHFTARQLKKKKKKTGAPVINKPTLGKFYFGSEEKVI